MFKRSMAIVIIFTLLISLITPVYAVKNSNTRIAKISEVKGDVKVFKKGILSSFNAFKGMSLGEGDIIKTGKASWITMKFDDDKDLKLSQNSRIDITTLSGSPQSKDDQTRLQLWNGKIWVDIQKTLNVDSKFEIKTPTSIAGVRGTKFFVGYEDEKLDIGVITGKVQADVFKYEKSLDGKVIKKESVTILEKNETISYNSSADTPGKILKQKFDIEKADAFIQEILLNTPDYVQYIKNPELIKNNIDTENKKQTQDLLNTNTDIPIGDKNSSASPLIPPKPQNTINNTSNSNTSIPVSDQTPSVSPVIPSKPQAGTDNKQNTNIPTNKDESIKEQQEKDKKDKDDKDKKEQQEKDKKDKENKNIKDDYDDDDDDDDDDDKKKKDDDRR